MSVARPDGMRARANSLFQNPIVRYLFAIATVASTFALRVWLIPDTGTGAPFVLFFAAVMVTSLLAGVGPGICALLISLPLAAYMFVMRAGHTSGQAAVQGLLFALDGIVVIYLTFLMKKERQAAQDASGAAERSMVRTREVIELAPDAFFQADLTGRFTDVNQAACNMLGYARDELLRRTIVDIIPPEDVPRLDATREYLLTPGVVQVAEWTQLRKDGTPISVEVSSNILPDGRWQAFVREIGERKRIELALQESEAKFAGIISTSADAVISIDDEQRITLFNNGAGQIFGYSNEEAIGTRIDSLIPDRFRSAHRQHIERFASGDVTARGRGERLTTLVGLRKNGEEFPAEATISKLEVGGKTLLTLALRDITERKRFEEELTAANASLDAIIENIPLMLFMKESKSLRFVRFNRAGEDLLGWTRDAFMGKSDHDFWPPEQAEFFVAKDRETLEGGKVVDITEEPIQTRHQGVRLLHTKKVPILDAAGHPIYLLGISEDITERRRIEKQQQFLAEAGVALSASLEYERTLATLATLVVQNGADWCAVDMMDEQGKMSRLKVASADPSKAALCAVLEQMPPDRDLPHLMRSVIESRQPLVVEHVTSQYIESLAQGPEHEQALLATGLTSFVAVPLLVRGRPLGALLCGSSTPSHVYGPDDLPVAEALASRAAIAIENARLYRASVHATQLRDQVLGVVAHDLRNPLCAIEMQASAALRHRGPEPERRSQKPWEVIHRAATSMDRMIHDLLDVALMEQGQLSIERARLPSRQLVLEAADLQRPLASSSSLELRVDVHGDVPEIWGDRDRLLQVFENLIGNAIKFTPAGGSITVGAAARTHEVLFWVADTGRGIASENLPHVFDRFWQATRAGRHGAGLGLPITKGIVEGHAGRIWVESAEGRGSTFTFTIPTVSPASSLHDDSRASSKVRSSS